VFRVTTAAEAAARDRAAIAAGISAFDLMLAAGTVAAAEVLRRFGHQLGHGVALFAGTGNNGGDAYVAAAQLARAGVTVRLHAAGPPRTPDAIRAAALAAPALVHGAPGGHERVVIDGLLGTGHQGPLRREIAAACVQLRQAFERGGIAGLARLRPDQDGPWARASHGLSECLGGRARTHHAHRHVTFGQTGSECPHGEDVELTRGGGQEHRGGRCGRRPAHALAELRLNRFGEHVLDVDS